MQKLVKTNSSPFQHQPTSSSAIRNFCQNLRPWRMKLLNPETREISTILWILNFLGKNYEKAQEIFDTHLNNTDFEYIKFQNILRESQDSKDEELISRLAQALLPNDKLTPPTKGAIISSQLQVLCDVGKAPEALEILKSHLNSNLIQITDLSAPAVLKLKSALEAAHLNFPYVIPRKPAHENRRRAKADTSDSSSGSDTD